MCEAYFDLTEEVDVHHDKAKAEPERQTDENEDDDIIE